MIVEDRLTHVNVFIELPFERQCGGRMGLRDSGRGLLTTFSSSIHAPLQRCLVFGGEWRGFAEGVSDWLSCLWGRVANFNGAGMDRCASE
jgi:hypothetical protein